jgi:O-acetyl-ADP-ribose deacetylase (regulator of RNase III)
MKIIYKQGDLLECTEKVIVHGCNSMGVMGSGVALAIRKKYPEAYDTYKAAYENGGLELGEVVGAYSGDKLILNAITQRYYGRDKLKVYADYEAIRDVFRSINEQCEYCSIAIPKIGAGLANGDWNVIEKIIEAECTDVQIVCYVL